MTRRVRIAMVAGEASGDLLAAPLLGALRERLPDLECFGIGGPRMQSHDFASWYPMETLSVRGYVEAARSIPKILGIRRALAARLEADPPDLFVGVDAPDFNLGLERRLRARGIRTLHYVSPSIWAWRGERIHRMAAAADHVLCLFPFEPPYYERVGVPVTWVGHPLADEIPPVVDRADAREQTRLPLEAPVFALLPGSRQGELAQHAALFVRTARAVLAECRDARFLVPLTSRPTRERFEAAVHAEQGFDLPLTVLFGHAQLAMAAADVVLVASGTATLETALMRRPMVITYRVPELTYRIMWPRRYQPWIGLPNVMAGEFVVPEILQHDATPANLANALVNLLRDKPLRERIERRFDAMYTTLRQGAAGRAADVVMAELRRNPAVRGSALDDPPLGSAA